MSVVRILTQDCCSVRDLSHLYLLFIVSGGAVSLHGVDTSLRSRPPTCLLDWPVAVSDCRVLRNFAEADAALLGVGLVAYLGDHHSHVIIHLTLLESRWRILYYEL